MSQCLTYGTLRFLVSRHFFAQFGGGFVLPYRWFSLGVGFDPSFWRWFRLILPLIPLGVGFGR